MVVLVEIEPFIESGCYPDASLGCGKSVRKDRRQNKNGKNDSNNFLHYNPQMKVKWVNSQIMLKYHLFYSAAFQSVKNRG